MKIVSDFLVIGTGIAGLTYALKVADRGTVALVTKRDIDVTATQLAQGGIASVFSDRRTALPTMPVTPSSPAPTCRTIRILLIW
jgi:aspartate oxidase